MIAPILREHLLDRDMEHLGFALTERIAFLYPDKESMLALIAAFEAWFADLVQSAQTEAAEIWGPDEVEEHKASIRAWHGSP